MKPTKNSHILAIGLGLAAVTFLLLVFLCMGCKVKDTKPPSVNESKTCTVNDPSDPDQMGNNCYPPPGKPPHPGPMHWVNNTGTGKTFDELVCDSSGLILASVTIDTPGQHTLFGGNGAQYGEYFTLQQAEDRAVKLVADPPAMGRDYLKCQ